MGFRKPGSCLKMQPLSIAIPMPERGDHWGIEDDLNEVCELNIYRVNFDISSTECILHELRHFMPYKLDMPFIGPILETTQFVDNR
jgi:hypothetical protein